MIGTFIGEETETTILSHELAHALWFTNDDYYKEMSVLVSNLIGPFFNSLKEKLMEMGYRECVIADEIHAYLSTSTISELNGTFKEHPNWACTSEFKKTFKDYAEGPLKVLQ